MSNQIAYEPIIVGSTAVGPATSKVAATREAKAAVFHFEGSVRYRGDGTAPTASIGREFHHGGELIVRGEGNIRNALFISISGNNLTVHGEYYDSDDVIDARTNDPVESEITSPRTASGEISVSNLTPVVQLQFSYGLNPREVTSLTDGSGAASVANSLLTISSGTTIGSDVILTSFKSLKGQPGQGSLGRWAAIYDSAGVAGTEAEMGVGNQEDGFLFVYQGTAFGILHRFAGKLEVQTLTITTGAVTASGTITINLDGVATEVEVVSGDSVQAVARAIGAVAFTEFESQVIGDTIVFISQHANDHTGTFSLVDTDTTGVVGAFVETITGATSSNDFTAQTAWNEDTMDGSGGNDNKSGMLLDPGKGNVYEVHFQGLGFGEIEFSIEDDDTGKLVHVHRIQYANRNTTPSIQNPTLPMFMHVDNGSTTSNITLKSSSMALFTEGAVRSEGLPNGITGTISGTVTTETSMIAIKNKPVFQSVSNRVTMRPVLLTFSCNGSGAAKFHTLRAVINPILGGNPSFADVSAATSVLSFDTAGTTVSGGNTVATWTFGNSATGFFIDLTPLTIEQPPGVLIVFTIQTDGGTTDASLGFLGQDQF